MCRSQLQQSLHHQVVPFSKDLITTALLRVFLKYFAFRFEINLKYRNNFKPKTSTLTSAKTSTSLFVRVSLKPSVPQ